MTAQRTWDVTWGKSMKEIVSNVVEFAAFKIVFRGWVLTAYKQATAAVWSCRQSAS